MDRYEEIVNICTNLTKAFSIKNGPLYVQLLVGKGGIKVNELACRIGGAFEDFFIPYISGFNILKAVIDSALGKEVDISSVKNFDMRSQKRCVATQLLFCSSGRIKSITPIKDIKNLPYILDAGYNYNCGDIMPQVENATARFGHAVIVGENIQETQENINDFYRRLNVISENEVEMLVRYYPQI